MLPFSIILFPVPIVKNVSFCKVLVTSEAVKIIIIILIIIIVIFLFFIFNLLVYIALF